MDIDRHQLKMRVTAMLGIHQHFSQRHAEMPDIY